MDILGKYYSFNNRFVEIVAVGRAIDHENNDLGYVIYLDGELDCVFIKNSDMDKVIVDAPYPFGRSGAV